MKTLAELFLTAEEQKTITATVQLAEKKQPVKLYPWSFLKVASTL